jgi:hypothetical protein
VAVVGRTCRSWRRCAIEVASGLGPPLLLTHALAEEAAREGAISVLDWAYDDQRMPHREAVLVAAIRAKRHGVVESLLGRIARGGGGGGGHLWGECAAAAALAHGGMPMLRRLRDVGCPWDEWTLVVAGAVCSADEVKALIEAECPRGPAYLTAAALGRVDVLDRLWEQGVIPFVAVSAGHRGRFADPACSVPLALVVKDEATEGWFAAHGVGLSSRAIMDNDAYDALCAALAALPSRSPSVVADAVLDVQARAGPIRALSVSSGHACARRRLASRDAAGSRGPPRPSMSPRPP